MHSVSVASLLLFIPAAFAQTASTPATHPIPTPRVSDGSAHTMLVQPGSMNCPVGLSTHRVPGGQVVEVEGKKLPSRLGYNLTLRALDGKLIRQADVKLVGIAGGRVVPAGLTPTDGDVSESFTITPGETPKAELHSVVYARQLTGVKWVEVDSLTYADGTVWRQKAGSVCRVAPDLYLPVNATPVK